MNVCFLWFVTPLTVDMYTYIYTYIYIHIYIYTIHIYIHIYYTYNIYIYIWRSPRALPWPSDGFHGAKLRIHPRRQLFCQLLGQGLELQRFVRGVATQHGL